MALEEYCAACTYLGENADSYGKYYCDRKGERHYACDPKCYNFCEAYSRSNSARENMYDNSSSHSSSGCYLTTVMCHILGYPDDNYYLQTLRTFRDTTLKQDIKYYPLLLTYDIVGPKISENLYNDEFRETIAKRLFNCYITKAIDAIEHNDTTTAVNIYVAMTHSLARRYNIATNIIIPDYSTINKKLLGHGRTRIRKLDEEII